MRQPLLVCNHPFNESRRTWSVLPSAVFPMLSFLDLLVLSAISFQDNTARRSKPYTYMDILYRIQLLYEEKIGLKLTRVDISWSLSRLRVEGFLGREKWKENYLQKNGRTGEIRECERVRSVQRMGALFKEMWSKAVRETKKLAKKAKEKLKKSAKALLSSPRDRKPPCNDYVTDKKKNKGDLSTLEALFEENKIRSYKLDGDLRCRKWMNKTLKNIKMTDLLLATAFFVQNRFLMDANAHGWLVARANSLRAEGKESFVNGRQINRYQDCCPSMPWFVKNIHKLLEGAYNYTTPEERARIREEARKLSAPPQSSLPSAPSSEFLARMEKKRLEKEGQDKVELQAKRDREASHRARPYWNDLRFEDRQSLEAQFIEAIRKGETTLDPETNTKDKFFKILKEQMLLTWLGYQLPEA